MDSFLDALVKLFKLFSKIQKLENFICCVWAEIPGKNFGLDWCKQPDVGLPKPDLILFLQLNPEAAAERGNFGQERYETSSFQEKVLQCFYCLMEDKTLNWKTVDASKSIEDLHREIKSIAKETMQEVQNKPLGELWK